MIVRFDATGVAKDGKPYTNSYSGVYIGHMEESPRLQRSSTRLPLTIC